MTENTPKKYTSGNSDVRYLKRLIKDLEVETNKRLNEVEKQSYKNDEQIKTINKVLDDIKDDTKWIRRTFTTILFTGTFSGAISLVVWLIQR